MRDERDRDLDVIELWISPENLPSIEIPICVECVYRFRGKIEYMAELLEAIEAR